MVKRVVIRVASGRNVAERWRSQYQHPKDGWSLTSAGGAKEKYERICALGVAPDPEAVAEIIGNKSWTHIDCSGCGESVARAVSYGSDYSEHETILCEPCLADGLRAIQAKENA